MRCPRAPRDQARIHSKQNMDAVQIDTAEELENDDTIENTVPDVCRICLLGNLMMRDLFVENDLVPLSTKAMSFASVKVSRFIFEVRQSSI